MASSDERLQLNFLTLFERQALTDCTIIAQGQEVNCHKVILAAQSEWFAQQFKANKSQATFNLEEKFKVVKALVRFMYFGGLVDETLGPEDGLDLLDLSEKLGISALGGDDIAPMILPRLTPHNAVLALEHEALGRNPVLHEGICTYVGNNFLDMLKTDGGELLRIPRDGMPGVMRAACHHVANDQEADSIVRFCLQHSQMDSACDLLRDSKTWNWPGSRQSMLRSPPDEVFFEGPEWSIEGVRTAMETTPARIVVGDFFDWCIRLDYGAEGKLRIVYESATPREDSVRCINRFPAAMFAWRVLYKGQDVFNEKPVFICFPENVSLHWSTTLPVSASELSDDDSLQIMVSMTENPMLSLVLYYFSADLKTTVFSEDILNRLPHIEYRCLSSYSLVKTHVQQG